jgi:hypothetical protein
MTQAKNDVATSTDDLNSFSSIIPKTKTDEVESVSTVLPTSTQDIIKNETIREKKNSSAIIAGSNQESVIFTRPPVIDVTRSRVSSPNRSDSVTHSQRLPSLNPSSTGENFHVKELSNSNSLRKTKISERAKTSGTAILLTEEGSLLSKRTKIRPKTEPINQKEDVPSLLCTSYIKRLKEQSENEQNSVQELISLTERMKTMLNSSIKLDLGWEEYGPNNPLMILYEGYKDFLPILWQVTTI